MPSSSSSSSTYRPSNRTPRPPAAGGSTYVPGYSNPYAPPNSIAQPHVHNPPQQLQTQQIFIPNDLVGCIIGKGGSKINEIRHMSASQIKIMEPGATAPGMAGAPGGSENERLVIITGQPQNIQMAVQLLYHVGRSSLHALIVFTQSLFSVLNKRNRNSSSYCRLKPALFNIHEIPSSRICT